MLERLSQLIRNKELSASKFADEIGVQRSSVSHVLSGRNKPSLDFITKVVLRYPDINPEWLLTGRGEMIAGKNIEDTSGIDMEQQSSMSFEEQQDDAVASGSEEVYIDERPVKAKTGRDKRPAGSHSIEKIVIFYKNGSFSEYSPNQ